MWTSFSKITIFLISFARFHISSGVLNQFCSSAFSLVFDGLDSLLYERKITLENESYSHPSIECGDGHWPVQTTCKTRPNDTTWMNLGESILYSNSHLPGELRKYWNFILKNNNPVCDVVIENSIFLPIPYDKKLYQSDGSNYYVIHTDILLPLWFYLKKYLSNCGLSYSNGTSPVIIPVVVDSSGVNLITDAFSIPYNFRRKGGMDDISHVNNPYWVTTIQNLFPSQLFPLPLPPPTESLLRSLYGPRATVCFREVSLGVPSLYRLSDVSLQAFVTAYRRAVLRSTIYDLDGDGDERQSSSRNDSKPVSSPSPPKEYECGNSLAAERMLCCDEVKRVGLLARRTRRRILNEAELLQGIVEAGRRWCDGDVDVAKSKGLESRSRMGCSVAVSLIEYGTRNHEYNQSDGHFSFYGRFHDGDVVTRDIIKSQELAVLLGLQGSGLINGLYMPVVSTVVAIYTSEDWPLSGGDPLQILGKKGAYIRLVAKDTEGLRCNHSSTDKFCDSGDISLGVAEVTRAVIQALHRHESACQKLLISCGG